MPTPVRSSAEQGSWISLWIVALLSLLGQLGLCGFFSFGDKMPLSIDIEPSNLWKFGYHVPPQSSFLVLNWLGIPNLAPPLNPFSLAANLPPWFFFTAYTPVMATLALLAMAAFLRELELPRPAALYGGVIFAWQGDLLPFVFPGHFAYIATWFFFAVAAWGALRANRTRHWAYAVISGTACGLMVGLQPDRGAIASLLVAALYIVPSLGCVGEWKRTRGHYFALGATAAFACLGALLHSSIFALGGTFLFLLALAETMNLRQLVLCSGLALLISLAPFLALFQSNIVNVKLGGESNRGEIYKFVTQFSLSPEETLTYLVPGFFGWHNSHASAPYWGRIGQWPDWPQNHQGTRNLNLAISTTGTVATVLALMGVLLLMPGRWLGSSLFTERQFFYGRLLLALGFIALILSWGWHTPFYRPLFALPLMDKWRNPLKWLEMTNFALVTLSAFGLQHLLISLDSGAAEIKAVRSRLFWFVNGMLGLLGIGLLASYPFAIKLARTLQTASYDATSVANIMAELHWSLLVALILMVLFSLLLFNLWHPERLRGWTLDNPLLHRIWQAMLQPNHLALTLALGLALLSVVQLGWVAGQFVQQVDASLLTATNPLLDELQSEGDAVRVSVIVQDEILNVLLQNQFVADHISCLEISAASRVPDDFGAFLHNFDEDQARLWFLAGVKNVVVPQQYVSQMQRNPLIVPNIDHADGYMLEPTSSPNLPSHALVAMRDYLAKATVVPGAEVLPSDGLVLKRLKDPKWNPRETILVNSSAPTAQPSAQANPSISDKANLKTYTPQKIEVEAQSARGGYLLINDQYDPDWQVRVNGQIAPLLRADYILRAIPIPPGSSTISLRYVAHYRLGGLNLPVVAMNAFCDIAMLIAWIVAGLALWRKKGPAAATA